MSINFARNIKYLRAKKGLSQNKLAQLTKVNQSTIKRWEEDLISPSIDNVDSLAKVFNISISDLIEKDLIFEDNNVNASDIIKMPIETKSFKRGEEVSAEQLANKINELQDKIDKIRDNLQ